MAATNQNLQAMVAAGKFRQDLFYRLNLFTITLSAAVRERSYARQATVITVSGSRTQCRGDACVDPAALAVLGLPCSCQNVRKLENAVRYAVVCGQSARC